jgi:hypothetical protein
LRRCLAAGVAGALFLLFAAVLWISSTPEAELPAYVPGGGSRAAAPPPAVPAPPETEGAEIPQPPAAGAAPLEAAGADRAVPPSRPPLAGGESELEVFLLDSASRPLGGALVRLESGLSAGERLSDSAGEALFSRIAAGFYSLRIEAPPRPALVSARQIVLASGERRRLRVKVGDFDLAISGRVLERGGGGIPGIAVEAYRHLFQPDEGLVLPWDQSGQRVLSAADGSYIISGLDEGDYELRTEPAGEYPSAGMLVRAGVEAADLVLEVGRRLRLVGRVMGAVGQPLAGAEVSVAGQPGARAQSGIDGFYALDLVIGGQGRIHSVQFRCEGYLERRLNLAADETEGEDEWALDAELEPRGRTVQVTGSLASAGGEAVAGETVHLSSPALNVRLAGESRRDGSFAIPAVPPAADYRLWIHARGPHRDFAISSLEVPPEGLVLDLKLEPLAIGRLSGRVVNGIRQPLPRFSLWVRSTSAVARLLRLTSDEHGEFELDAVPEGELLFETRSHPEIRVRGLVLEPGGDREVELVVDWGDLALAGTITSSSGEPLPGAQLDLYWSHQEGSLRASSYRGTASDEHGNFVFPQLGPGEHKLRVSAPGYRTLQAAYDVSAGGAPVVVRLEGKGP